MVASFRVEHPGELAEATEHIVNRIAYEIRDAARQDTPVDTGTLQSDWRVEKSNRSGEYRVANYTDYAPFVEYGHDGVRPAGMLGRAVGNARSRYGAR